MAMHDDIFDVLLEERIEFWQIKYTTYDLLFQIIKNMAINFGTILKLDEKDLSGIIRK